jgi:hypothetical protein
MNSNSTMTREEQRKARARVDQERHLAKVKKEKAWLAANPHIAAQQEREKEEQRLNRETLRMLNAMKEQELAQEKKKKKPVNAFAALMDDSDTEEEEQEEQEEQEEKRQRDHFESIYEDKNWRDDMSKWYTESPDYVPTPKPVDALPEKKFVWADECDE